MMLVLYVIALLLLVKKLFYAKSKREVTFLFAFLVAAVLLALYEQADLSVLLLGTLIFNGIAGSFKSGENYVYVLLAFLLITPIYQLSNLIAQSALLGMLSGSYVFTKPNTGREPGQEQRRDVFQIFMGLFFIGIFAITPLVFARLSFVALILLVALVGNYVISSERGALDGITSYFERKNAAPGQGAFWITIGGLLAASFLTSSQTIAVLSAIFLGDAAATLVGMRYRLPIPYNRKKSVYGTVAYFVVASAVSFPFVGQIALLVSLVGALVESLDRLIDDNFDTAAVLTVLIKILGYIGLM